MNSYYTSKLLQILLARALSDVLRKQGANGDKDAGRIVVNSLTPGYCLSGLVSDAKGIHGILFKVMAKTLARTTEVGGRILVSALAMGEESHGQYINDGEIQEYVTAVSSVHNFYIFSPMFPGVVLILR